MLIDERPYDTQLLEEVIEQLGYSYEKTAVMAGLSSTTLTQVRKAEEGVKVKTLRKLARAVGLRVEIRFIRGTG